MKIHKRPNTLGRGCFTDQNPETQLCYDNLWLKRKKLMPQAIELNAGSTPLTLLITSASQVPHKPINLDEIPETVQACLTK